MHIRKATAADLPDLASMASEAFWSDDLFEFLSPYRTKYPADFRSRFLRGSKKRLYSGSDFLVVETSEGDPEWTRKPELAGQAVWTRNKSAPSTIWSRLGSMVSFTTLELWLLWLADKYLWYTGLELSESKHNIQLWRASIAQDSTFDDLGDHWHLEFLVVSPKFQRRGFGASLVDWGLERAEADKLPAIVFASPVGQGLYRKKGFQDIAKLSYPIGTTSTSMLWHPKGTDDPCKSYERETTENENVEALAVSN